MAKQTRVTLDQPLIDSLVERLADGRPIRNALGTDGLLNIDRQLPFLFVYRAKPDEANSVFAEILTGGASYLLAPTDQKSRAWTSRLIGALAGVLSQSFGAVLIIELWPSAKTNGAENTPSAVKPGFVLRHGRAAQSSATVERLASSLERIGIMKQRANVERAVGAEVSRPGMPRLFSTKISDEINATVLGIEVTPIYINAETGDLLPLVGRTLARLMSRSLQLAAFEFAQTETNDRSLHFHALGRRTFVAAAKQVDGQLTSVAESFDLLMAVTPMNTEAAFRFFRRSKFERPPRFHYRPTPVDPDLLKRQLWDIKIERVEDPVLDQLFREKRRELDLKLTLLADRERPRFVHTSMALYGRISDDLRASAADILEHVPGRDGTKKQRNVSAGQLIARAEEELDRLRASSGQMDGRVIVLKDVASLMVSSGNLIVGADMTFPSNRVEPLIQHEVGTHVLTYWNGRAQPFKLLAAGLAGHDELQEGLAVFVEYLVGGLTAGRLRTLAARVVAVSTLLDGASFVETFRLLRDDCNFSDRMAFMVTMRVFRGGGLTKDAVYLRGLQSVMKYLAKGGRLDTLFIGKIATEHASVIEELQRRQVLVPPPFRPSYLDQPDSHYRIERIRGDVGPVDLVDA